MQENKGKTKEVLKLAHLQMADKFLGNEEEKDRFLLGNRVIAVLGKYPDAGPTFIKEKLGDFYGVDIPTNKVINCLKAMYLGNPEERAPLFRWVVEMDGLLMKAIEGNKQSYDAYVKMKNNPPAKCGSKRRAQDRIIIICLFSRMGKLDEYQELNRLMYLGNTKSSYCLLDLEEAVTKIYNGKAPKDAQDKKSEVATGDKKLSYAEALQQVAELEAALQRTHAMLKDLQDEFEEQIAESKAQELTDFFSRLNSDSYGRILDGLFAMRKGINELRIQHYELPKEISGLMIMAIKLLQFTKDSHIDPIMMINNVVEVKASDIECCAYEGSPFNSETEVKKVKVISPGWIFRDKDIQISRPKLKEVK